MLPMRGLRMASTLVLPVVEADAEQVLGGGRSDDRAERRDTEAERRDAEAFLREVLADGPVPSKEVMADARANGIARGTLVKAKSSLGVQSKKRGFGSDGEWVWVMADEEATGESGRGKDATEGPKAAKPDAVAALGDEKAIGPTRTGGSSKNANSADVTALADADLASSTPSSLAKDASPADLEALARTPGNIDESEPSAPNSPWCK